MIRRLLDSLAMAALLILLLIVSAVVDTDALADDWGHDE